MYLRAIIKGWITREEYAREHDRSAGSQSGNETMITHTSTDPDFAACVAKIEAAYQYMLAYAAQGREQAAGGGAGPSLRDALNDLETGLIHVTSAARLKMAELQAGVEALQALEIFSEQLQVDADRALKVLRVVLTAPALSSQLIDNLNASVALRCLLTDLFVLDEAIRQHLRAGLARPA